MNKIEQALTDGCLKIKDRTYRPRRLGALANITDNVCQLCRHLNDQHSGGRKRDGYERYCPTSAYKELVNEFSPNLCEHEDEIWVIDDETGR